MAKLLSKWYLRWKSKYRYRRDSAYTMQENPATHLRAAFNCLEPDLFDDLDYGKASTIVVSVEYISLKKVNEYMATLLVVDIREQKLETSHIISNRASIPFGSMFIADGVYSDPMQEVKNFKQQSLKIIQMLESVQTETTGISGFNYRILNRFIMSLVEIANALRKYSNE